MKHIVLIPMTLAALLAGCVPAFTPKEAVVDGRDTGSQPSAGNLLAGCNGAAVQDRLGRPYTPEEQRLLRTRSGATVLRPVRPGEAVSMDFLTNRLTIDLDGRDVITALRCG